jgi:Protein of unknown function (DUF4238)
MASYANNHIASAGYLKGWVGEAGRLARVSVGWPSSSELKRPQKVGFRRRFFSDPKIARAAESRFGVFESEGIASLERLGQSWPPTDRDRLAVSKLVAIHMVRNPAFIEATTSASSLAIVGNLDEYRDQLTEDQTGELIAHLTGEAFRVEHMLDLIPKHTSLIASMHWTLLQFPEPLLATSDQPVTVVPLSVDGTVAEVSPMPSTGYLMTEEIRFALDPWRALVFTWINDIDAPHPVLASDDFAADLNRGVIAQADREWFHHPSRRATRLKPDDLDVSACNSLGHSLFPEYSSTYAVESPRRLHVAKLLSNMIEGRVNNAFHVARVRRALTGPASRRSTSRAQAD